MSRLVVISQPTYLPWLGYFDLLDQADVFVVLDHVQLERRSWQTRNRIRTAQGLQWLSIPLHSHQGQSLLETRVEESRAFPRAHLEALALSYRKTPYFEPVYSEIEAVLRTPPASLVELNLALIERLARMLGIQPSWLRSSQMEPRGRRSEMLMDLLAKTGATAYLSSPGAEGYLNEERAAFGEMPIYLHTYEHPVYQQRWKPFMAYASVVDLLFNHGPGSLDIQRSGRRPSRLLKGTAPGP